jgi:diaminopimelate decarboxylase
VIVDAAMNDLLRPSLYDAWHDIRAVVPRGDAFTPTVVGPICESGDTFAKRPRDGPGGGGRSRRLHDRRRLWRDDGQHL